MLEMLPKESQIHRAMQTEHEIMCPRPCLSYPVCIQFEIENPRVSVHIPTDPEFG